MLWNGSRFRVMNWLFQQDRSVFKTKPGIEVLGALGQSDDACAPHKAFFSISIVAGSTAIGKTYAIQAARKIIDMVMSAEGAQHITHFKQSRE